MADYYVDDNGNVTTKKKKKKKQADYIVNGDGKVTKVKEEVKTDNEDIAPTKTQKERTWFEKGALEDGFSLKNLGKTVVGTITDTAENLGSGIMGMGEKVVDALVWASPYIAEGQFYRHGGAYLNPKVAKQQKEFFDTMKKGSEELIEKDLYDEEKIAKKIISAPVKAVTGINADTDSVFGEKTDSVMQSGGQLLGTVGLQAVGVPWFVTSGVTAFGGETENALKQGATMEEAGLSGAITAGAEILTEKISGGIKFGGKTLDDGLTNLLAKKISNKFVRTGLKLGLDAVGEGGEEWLSEDISRFGQWLTYQDEETLKEMLFSEEAMDEKIEAFIGGAMLGGVSSTGKAVKSAVNGVDYVSGLTKNEQSVVDKVVENRVAEAKENGEKVNKSKIYAEVIRDLEKGYISTDTIESVLGGDSYKAYKDTTDFETQQETTLNEQIKALEDEINTSTDNTTEQRQRLSDLRKQLENLKTNSKQGELRKTLSENVYGIAKDSKLVESYNEIARRGQTFNADMSKYTEKEQAVVQKAIDSGILNNSNKTHEFVDMVAKISADKGVSFDFANNTKLKESGFARDGVTINGFVTKDGITLNIDSAKALNTVTGHEISHVLEGTELYNAFQQTMFDYAKSKGDFDSRYKALQELYKDVEGANIEAELTADLVGDYLFTDADFINHLSTKNRNVFQKVYDEIKYLCKVATAGSKEARELEKVKRAFEKAYRESGETQSDTDGSTVADTQYSISVTDKGTIDFLENQEHIVTYKSMQLIDGKLYPPMVAKVKGKDGKYHLNNPSELGVWQQATEDPTNIKKMKNGVGYYTLNKGDGTSIDAAYNPYEHSSNLVLNDQFESAHRRNNLVTVECVIPVSEMSSGYHAQYAKDSTGVMDWKSGVVAGQIKDNKRKVYLSRYLKPVRILSEAETASKYKEILDGTGVSVPFNVVSPSLLAELEKAGVDIDYEGSPMYKSIQKRRAEKEAKKNKAKYSLTPEQQEFFKDSKVRDEKGNLKVMYHGTSKGGHTVFDTFGSNYGLFGQGSYFTDSKAIAETYTKKGKGNNPQVYESYLNIKNPIDMDSQADLTKWEKALPDVDFSNCKTNEDCYRAMEEYIADEQLPKWEGAEMAIDTLMSMGYDGVTHIGGGRVNADGERHRVYIAFEPEQIKNIDNTKPTENPDIRYSLSSDSEGNKLTEGQESYFKDSKMRDDNGNLTVMYHGSQDAGFHEFEQLFSDDNTSFFFVDRNDVAKSYSGTSETYTAPTFHTADDFNKFFAEIGMDEYEVKEEMHGNYKWFVLYEDGDEVASSETAKMLYDEFRDWTGVGRGSANYKVYLNLKNPLIVDAKGRSWDRISSEFSQEAYDKYKTLTEDEKSALVDLAGWEDFGMFKSELQSAINSNTPDGFTMSLASAYKKLGGDDIDLYRLFDIATDNFSEQSLKENAVEYLNTRNYSQNAKEQGYDGVIFKNIVDNGVYASGNERYTPSTVAIAFESNQIKSVANQNPTEKADIRYSISGINANNANSSMLLRAEHLLNAGADSETVRQETGWYKGYDGKMRFEIDDSKSKLIKNPKLEKHEDNGTYFTGKLSDILDHSELYEAYPQLRNVNIIIQPTNIGTMGIYQPNSNYITLSIELFKRHTKEYSDLLNNRQAEIKKIEESPEYKEYSKWHDDEAYAEMEDAEKWLEEEEKARVKFFSSELGKRYYQLKWGKSPINKFEFGWSKEAKSVLMHEVQHAVQKIEGFARGSSESYWNRQLEAGLTIKTKEQREKQNEAEKRFFGILDKDPTFFLEMNKLINNAPDMPRGKIDWDTLEEIEEDPVEWQEFDKQRDALEEKYGTLEVFDFIDLYHNVKRLQSESLTASDAYYYTAGEIEARDTENRLNLNAEQRRKKRPDIDNKRVVFAESNYSLSKEGEIAPTGKYNVYGKDIKLETETEDIAPSQENTLNPDLPIADIPSEPSLYDLIREKEDIESRAEEEARKARETGNTEAYLQLAERHRVLTEQIEAMQKEQKEAFYSISDEDAPPETEAPYYAEDIESNIPDDPMEDRNLDDVGNRKIKAYQYEHPEVKPFFRQYAEYMLTDLRNSVKGERNYNDELYWNTNGEQGWTGVKRQTTPEIEALLDNYHYTYAEIEKGIKAIIEDNGAENNACSKRIEIFLHDWLMKGYEAGGHQIPPNQDYINLLNAQQIDEYYRGLFNEGFEAMENNIPVAETVEDIAPVKATEQVTHEVKTNNGGNIKGQQTMLPPNPPTDSKIAETHAERSKTAKQKERSLWSYIKEGVLDKGMVFETLSKKTKNRELEAKWNFIRNAESMAQNFMKNGKGETRSLSAIRKEVGKDREKAFDDYMYHLLNTDRMTLEERYGTPNKAVYGYEVTADESREIARLIEEDNPDFKQYAQDVYDYMTSLRNSMVEKGVISQQTADLWAEMYPHYVPIHRNGDSGLNINVPLDTNKTGVNAPVKRATGGNRDILPLFDTMAERTIQTYKAIARNSFGVELKNTLNSVIESEATDNDIDTTLDNIDTDNGFLKEGKNGFNPTFTVFENGERVEFEITEEMYDALKPKNKVLAKEIKPLSFASKVFRGLTTEYNPVFMLTNPIKDAQDIIINSQHALKTYGNIPTAIKEMTSKGKWYKEYVENGGESNTYFDSDKNVFKEEHIGMKLNVISNANNYIEMIPRLAEYIASRKAGRSVEVSMLDASRVTTNFKAGGDLTKFLNKNGATFLNASVQGAVQQARNIQEAKMNGLKGWVGLATKTILAGLPALALNNLLWDDDEEYEELADYVKQNYYVVAKYGDGQFVRIPKGRTVAVIQDAFQQISNIATGNDKADLGSFLELAISNLAPNNPLDNNIIAPIIQAKNNKTWYGEDLVPSRLKDLPKKEQFDESTDAISKWLGETFNDSPYKINYVLNQYSGGLGDIVLPMLTPEAERGDNSFAGNVIAPFKDKFTTDSTMNNQNVSDFYKTKEELTTNAKSSNATDEDILRNKFFNAVNAELSDLYAQKREIQNSDLSNSEKYSQVRDIQKQINAITRETLNNRDNVSIDGNYATSGHLHYRLNKDGEWQKITDKQLEKQEEVTNGLGITPSDYWGNKEEYDYAYEYPEKYAVSKAVGGYEAYKSYSSELYDIKADKDGNGKSISGSRKAKVVEYIDNLDIDYGEKLILYKNEYNADDTFNYEIIEYLDGRDDISYDDAMTILEELGFTVNRSNGNISWN